MKDERITKLAAMLIHHSIRLQPKERILIRGHINTKPLLKELIDETYRVGAYPYVELEDDEISRHLLLGNVKEQLDTSSEWALKKYTDIDAVIIITGEENDGEMTDVPVERHRLQGEAMNSSTLFYVNNRRWVLLNYPTNASAQKAGMSFSRYEDFLLNVCTMDYGKMEEALKPLKQLMERTDKVRIISPGTDLTFSIKGMPAIICAGKKNLPDGEVFTAPLKESVNGRITFNTPTTYEGITFSGIELTFRKGKIMKAISNRHSKMHEILDIDEGSRFIGEFAIGINPYILEPMDDTLFDEKISGSLHLALGLAYDEADNGNRSSIHWDMVLIQRPEYGGGDIYFDDVLIRRDGVFILPELRALNPNLLK
ncbi:Aminopeptidase 2 [Peribacillus sp. Bi96]|uniref:aminopeptidase n=1 Tax=Peribacillus sp. Bi96 TaxID=2884273 RepID=UPI001D6FC470|nr:aminopeptidase [Peribacillus sp. Bi96]CAH0246445.1 Aminopeptidase 2 [Peribacillus sp. Bi96]